MIIVINDNQENNFKLEGSMDQEVVQFLKRKFANRLQVVTTAAKIDKEKPHIALRNLRQLKRISQTELAAAIGTTPQYINGIEREKFSISIKFAKKLATYFNCDYEIFL